MKKILVIGGTGMVASRFIDAAREFLNITSVDERTINITDKNKVRHFFSDNNFDAVVNFAAFTDVDAAENQKNNKEGLVWKLNVLGTKFLAKECENKNIFLIHISTDFVFPGSKNNPGPYEEESIIPDSAEGMGWYGWTKNRAERLLFKSGGRIAIVRYAYPFRSDKFENKKDWARNLIKLYSEQKLYPLFSDQIQSILYIDDLVDPLLKIINKEITGIFHISSKDRTSPYEAGKYLLEKYSNKYVDIKEASLVEYLKHESKKAPRPIFGGLRVEKTEEKLGTKFRTWKEMVDDFVKNFSEV